MGSFALTLAATIVLVTIGMIATPSSRALAQTASASDEAKVGSGAAVGWIEIVPRDDELMLRARVLAVDTSSGTAMLRIERAGSGGRARVGQGGAFELDAGTSTVVSETGLSFSPGDTLSATLTIEIDGETVSTATVDHGPS